MTAFEALKEGLFPASLEVGRYLYQMYLGQLLAYPIWFPAPLEVDRKLYKSDLHLDSYYPSFPAPLEVDREAIYNALRNDFIEYEI